MRPKLELLDKPFLERILEEAFRLIEDPGVRVAPYVVELLRAAGITVKDGAARIPEALARRLLDLAPRGFCLYDRGGNPAVRYGGDGQTSKTARGIWRRDFAPPLSMAISPSSVCRLDAEKAPVTTGFSEYPRTSSRRYQSPISWGTSLQTMAVDCAANCGSISATCTSYTRSAASAGRACWVWGSRMFRHDEPGSKWTSSPP